jgi:hypothetical protein
MATTGLGSDRSLLPRLARAMTASLGLGEVLAAACATATELMPDSLVLVWVLHGDRLVLRGAAGVLDGAHRPGSAPPRDLRGRLASSPPGERRTDGPSA